MSDGTPLSTRNARALPIEAVIQPACAAVACELRAIRAEIEKLAMIMVSDRRLVRDHAHHMQSFDLIIQHAEECASLLERIAQGYRMSEALGGVRLAAMQRRLHSHIEGA